MGTTDVIFESARRFEVWDWGVGHRGLLLRSNPTETNASRVEVWFKPADLICLPAVLDGLVVKVASAVEDATVRQSLGWTWERVELFSVGWASGRGWVVAGGVHGRQDEREYYDHPMFDGRAIQPGTVPLFSYTASLNIDDADEGQDDS